MTPPRINRSAFFYVAIFYLIQIIALPGVFILLSLPYLYPEMREQLWITISGVTLFAGCFLIYLILTKFAYCPLCRAQLFGYQKCVHHEKARKFFGLPSLALSLDILRVAKHLRCSYCGHRFRFRPQSGDYYQSGRHDQRDLNYETENDDDDLEFVPLPPKRPNQIVELNRKKSVLRSTERPRSR